MEREGIYYFFEQGDDGEKLIVADVPDTLVVFPDHARFFVVARRAFVYQFRRAQGIRRVPRGPASAAVGPNERA